MAGAVREAEQAASEAVFARLVRIFGWRAGSRRHAENGKEGEGGWVALGLPHLGRTVEVRWAHDQSKPGVVVALTDRWPACGHHDSRAVLHDPGSSAGQI